ncbi:MAG: CPBP family intramembrane metalloprotease [Candidatus Heimdallarchaeota archaeon]|nr:MAG: CPBP family intramembrane metalloprotease [Candidatus Heimdallarchaeota archaeon]
MEKIQPMSLGSALLHFLIPALLVTLNIYLIMAFFVTLGLPIFVNYFIIYATLPMLLLLLASIIAYQREGNEMTWMDFTQRFRLKRMTGRDWLWTILLFLIMFLSVGILSFTSIIIASFLPPPTFWPDELNPLKRSDSMGTIPTEFVGQPLPGNWWVVIVLFISLIIATFGEELWWRGYILPRQELEHGEKTWIIHGILWGLFHFFLPWNLIALLPGTITLSYVAQKLKNTWPAIIAHGLANGLMVMVVVILGIIGA